jgi:hypothetical protein
VFDVIRFCQDYGVDYALKGKQVSKGWIGLPDVFNKSNDTEYHLGFNIAGSYFYSWIDGWHSVYSWLEIVASGEDIRAILVEYGDEISYVRRFDEVRHNAETISFSFGELPKQARQYISGRRFDPDTLIKTYGLRWGGIVGNFAYRIVIPLYDKSGELVSYQGRFIGTDKSIPRYKTLSIEKSLVDPKSILYNENNVTGNTIYVMEGFFNVARWGENAVASLGTSFTESQVRLLSAYKRVIILFDSEVQAQGRAKKLATRVSAMKSRGVEIVDLELGDNDIADCSDEAIQEFKQQIG